MYLVAIAVVSGRLSWRFRRRHPDESSTALGKLPSAVWQCDEETKNRDSRVDVNPSGRNAWVKTGSVNDQAFKFNATGVGLGDITVNRNNPGQTLAAQTGAFDGDGTGTFGFGIACTTCKGGASDQFSTDIIFHVASATIADLTAPNPSGNVFVADIIGSTRKTGPVYATSDPIPAPEPTTLALLGSGLMGFGLLRRRNGV